MPIETIQLRRDTAANWASVNPVLAQCEAGVETDTGKAKLGDGATAWNSLSYWNPSGLSGGGGGGGGAVSSVFGRSGAVTAQSGDYTAAQVGADASGAASTAQGAAETYAAGLVTAETSRAETAEALRVQLAGDLGSTAAAPQVESIQGNPLYAASYSDAGPAVSPATGALWDDTTNLLRKQYNGGGWQPVQQVGPTRDYRSPDIKLLQTVWMGQASPPFSIGGTHSAGSNADTSTYAIGSQSIYVTTNGSGAQATISGSFGSALNMTGQCLVVWLRVDSLANLDGGYPRLFLGDTGLTNCYYWKVYSSATQPWALDGEWLRLTLPFGSAIAIGSPNRASLAALTIQIYDDSSGTSTVRLGGVATMPEPQAFPNGVLSLCFDDGYLSQYQTAAPAMDAYGYRGTGYLICETIYGYSSGNYDNYMTLAQIQAMEEQRNWEFGSHAFTAANHNSGYVAIGDSAALADMQAAKAYLAGVLGTKAPGHFAYPLGAFDANTVLNVQGTFGSGRTISSLGAFPDETFPPATTSRLRSYVLSESNGIGSVPGFITAAQANKEWLILTTHDIQASGASGSVQFSLAHWNTVLAGIAAAEIPVLPVSEVLKLGEIGITPMTTLGDTIYANGNYSPAPARLAGNTSATKKFLAQTGTGSASAAPAWETIAAGDITAADLAGLFTAYKQTASAITPSATEGTYGTAVTIGVDSGYSGFLVVQVYYTATVEASDTVVLQSEVTFTNNSTVTQALETVSSTITTSMASATIATMLGNDDGLVVKSIAFSLKSTALSSSTSSASVTVMGLNLP